MSKSHLNSNSLQILETKDGSQTILNESLGSTYHSRHGAVTESKHVFIDKGLRKLLENDVTKITLLEMGFGTGLNVLLTLLELESKTVQTEYHSLELYPIPDSVWNAYQLPKEISDKREIFEAIHQADWGVSTQISESFELTKHHLSLLNFEPRMQFDLIYYDAFEPETQPELWTVDVFSKLFSWLEPNGILTTYCCKGYVRRNMIEAGFVVEKVPGPPGKREMICAKKPL